MPTFVDRAARELFRRERLPVRVRWWFVAEGMCEWYRLLAEDLAPYLGGRDGAKRALSEVSLPMFRRRYGLLSRAHPSLPDDAREPRAIALVLGALYRVASNTGAAWIFAGAGGAPRAFRDHARAEAWIQPIPMVARWEELTHHLGELLVALTDGLPARMDRARPILGELCFAAGVRYARKMRRAFGLEGTVGEALEILRMSEYVFRVNPDHWGTTDERARTGFLEGTACPWYDAPGWNGAHCGIFGQFQSGIASAFGLRYHLTTTIPKHGGHTCRVDVRPAGAGRRRLELA